MITYIHRQYIHPYTPLNNFSSETPGPVFFKFHMESSVNGELEIGTNGHGLLIKMAPMSIYGKTLKIFSRTKKESWYIASGTQ